MKKQSDCDKQQNTKKPILKKQVINPVRRQTLGIRRLTMDNVSFEKQDYMKQTTNIVQLRGLEEHHHLIEWAK